MSNRMSHPKFPSFSCKLFIFLLIINQFSCIYSPYYKRCRINKTSVDPDAVPIQDLQIEILPNYPQKHVSNPIVTPELELNYTDYNYYFHQFIDSGSSGEVYLVQQILTGEGKVVKRFFQERPHQFRRENYLMKKLNYSIEWSKYCKGVDKCTEEDLNFNTIAIFPYRDSIVFDTLNFDGTEAPLIFYKVLKQLDRIHKAGIIHNDVKMGNIMVNSIGINFKFYQIQFIDWNLSIFYYTGLDQNVRRGTICYYSPQELFSTQYVTPARDIWALGILMYTFYTEQKPFLISCKTDQFKAVATLVGAQKMLQMSKKYNFRSNAVAKNLYQLQNNKQKYPERDLYNMKVKQNQQFYTKDLVDVFKRMFEADPQKRATASELLKMKYFRQLTTLPEMYLHRDKKKRQRQKENQQYYKQKGGNNTKN